MGKLIYSTLGSLDGYMADEKGGFGWAMPSDEVHAFVNDLQRPLGTHLYGRRLYEVLTAWEHPEDFPERNAILDDFAAIWQSADKIVYSSTLRDVSTARTRVERTFDPAAVRRLTEETDHDLLIGGPTLAAHALRAGLVDEVHSFIAPAVVGGGLAIYPDGVKLTLELLAERRFDNGMAYLHYAVH
ncbi:MAG: deaminase [Hamadaea sp.]|nr:deaminase [Hamadaea sp.]